jgi:hypothetical protein
MHKEIKAKNQVKMITSGMLDPCLHTWYLAQQVTLDAGTFNEYMMALRSAWLKMHWDMKLRKKVLGSQQGTCAFYEWALDLQNQNALLYSNPAYLTESQLHDQLEANICDDLMTAVLRAKLAITLMLKAWIEEVQHFDNKHLEDIAMHKRIVKDFYKSRCTNQSQTTTKTPSSSSCPPNNTSTSYLRTHACRMHSPR